MRSEMPFVVVVASFVGLLWAGMAQADPQSLLKMKRGEVRTLELASISRVAVGDPGIVEVKVEDGNLVLTAKGAGKTTVLVWRKSEERISMLVAVSGEDPPRSGEAERSLTSPPAAQRPQGDGQATAPVDQHLVLGAGEVRRLQFSGINRVAVADPSVVDLRVEGNNELELVARAAGETSVLVWRAGQPRYTMRVTVR
jgi:Flp pilus assembly secretin CpaC